MIGQRLGNRYEILEKIGEGGMSTVYKAKCHLLNRLVAVKVLKAEFNNDEELLGKFDKEAKSAASLQHPNIVNIYDVGRDGDWHYIVMELASTNTLKDFIKKQEVFLKNHQIVVIASQIAEALQMAHDRGIIHRDIKPQNILIGEDGKVKVADFGIARAATTSTIVNTNDAIGSVHYASPEQSRGGFVDKRSDIYSFGILLYELATGRVPFEGDTPITIALKHLKEQVVPPSLVNMNLNPTIERMIMKCIQKDVSARFQSIFEVIELLDQLSVNPQADITFDEGDVSDASYTMVLPNLSAYADLEEGPRMPMKAPEKKTLAPKEKEKINPMILMGTITVGVLVSLIIMTFIFINPFRDANKQVPFPLDNIVNMNVTEANTLLSNLGLNMQQVDTAYSDTVPINAIISQSPEAGTMVKSGQRIQVVTSLGPRLATMPNLINKQVEEAKVTLSNLKLVLIEEVQEFSDLPAGLVIRQEPTPNATIKEGDSVILVVSKGPENQTVLMPDVTGRTQEDAIRLLKELGLNYGAIETAFSEEVGKDLVADQSVKPGTEVTVGDYINLVISLGSENSTQDPPPSEEVTRPFFIPLKNDKELYIIKVTQVTDDGEVSLYEKIHKAEEERVQVMITGKGEMHLIFYIDNEKIDEKIEMFE